MSEEFNIQQAATDAYAVLLKWNGNVPEPGSIEVLELVGDMMTVFGLEIKLVQREGS